jgi:hypothetical protein
MLSIEELRHLIIIEEKKKVEMELNFNYGPKNSDWMIENLLHCLIRVCFLTKPHPLVYKFRSLIFKLHFFESLTFYLK